MAKQLLWCLFFVFLLEEAFYSAQSSSVHYYDFVLKETNVTKLCVGRQILIINDSFPGPFIRVQKGDIVYVNVQNQGDYGVTIHWHGVKQPGNPWSDGPEYITQCPIEPGSNFTYEVIFSEEEGTLWWHAHSDWTRATVYGAIVILPEEGSTFPFPEPHGEEIVILGSWYKEDLKEKVDEDMMTGVDLPHSSGYTINGELGDFSNCSRETTYHWNVDYEKTYLLRIINAVVNAELFFSIADHNLTVVGVDGSYVKPFVTSYIMISPGNTMDVLITTNQSPSNRYYMAARQYSSEYPEVTGFDHSNASAVLQYNRGLNSNSSLSPIFPDETLPFYLDFYAAINFTNRLRSLSNEDYPSSVPTEVTTKMYIVVSMNSMECPTDSCGAGSDGEGHVLASSMNNVSWINPSVDILEAYYRNISGAYTTDFPNWPETMYNFTQAWKMEGVITIQGIKVKVLEYNESVEIVFQGTDFLGGSVNHPMHMHGYSFYVVGIGHGNFDSETDPKSYNLVDPPKVNTFGVPKRGWVAIRFTANNPGVWFWHCHLDRHMSWGMNTAFIVKDGGTPSTSLRPPPSYMPPCPAPSDIRIRKSSHEHNGIDQL